MSPLTVDALTVSIGGRALVGPVSLQLADGEILGVVGESGSGKSLLLAAIAGLAPADAAVSGSIRLRGREVIGLDDRAIARLRGADIGFVFQEPMSALNPLQTIGAQIGEGLARDQNGAVHDALRLAELPAAFASRFPHQLSGGQRQRALIAMAVARRPRLLLADEPTTALDAVTQAEIISLLRTLACERDIAIILVTHDLGLAASVADRIVIMQSGRIVEILRASDGFGAPAAPYSKELLDAAKFQLPAPPAPGPAKVLSLRASADYAERSPFGQVRRRVAALRDVALDIAEGEALGLVGSSGCGKSTLARVILRLHPKGEAEIIEAAPEKSGPVQIVFQDPGASFNPRMAVGAIIAEPLWNRKDIDKTEALRRAAALLSRVGLPADAINRKPHQLSGGQRQRVAIARALIADPRLVILDEALSALDVTVRKQILILLAELQKERGLAFLMITHDMNVMRGFAQRMLVMDEGRIVDEGETEHLLTAPSHPVTRALVGAAEAVRRAL